MRYPVRLQNAFAASVVLLASLALAPAAAAQEWVVAKVSGSAFVSSGGVQKVSLSSGSALRPGGTIYTGGNGRALLVRGEERMLVGPNSVVGVPTESRPGHTVVHERLGSVLFDVERRNVKHFSVRTPYLAAVVKGTQFTVTVGRGAASVDVHRGLVEVQDPASGEVADIPPGQSASVGGSRGGIQIGDQPANGAPVHGGPSGRASATAIDAVAAAHGLSNGVGLGIGGGRGGEASASVGASVGVGVDGGVGVGVGVGGGVGVDIDLGVGIGNGHGNGNG